MAASDRVNSGFDLGAIAKADDLKKRLDMVLGKTAPAPRVVDESEEAVFDTPVGGGFNDSDITPSKSWGQEVSDFRQKAVASSPVEDEEDQLSYFAKLAEED